MKSKEIEDGMIVHCPTANDKTVLFKYLRSLGYKYRFNLRKLINDDLCFLINEGDKTILFFRADMCTTLDVTEFSDLRIAHDMANSAIYSDDEQENIERMHGKWEFHTTYGILDLKGQSNVWELCLYASCSCCGKDYLGGQAIGSKLIGNLDTLHSDSDELIKQVKKKIKNCEISVGSYCYYCGAKNEWGDEDE